MTGWVIESRLKNLSTLNVHWQNKQPDFYRNTANLEFFYLG